MNAALRLMGNLTDGRDGDGVDRVGRGADPTGPGGLRWGNATVREITRRKHVDTLRESPGLRGT